MKMPLATIRLSQKKCDEDDIKNYWTIMCTSHKMIPTYEIKCTTQDSDD